jgi:cobalt-zinc-cadmium efflux system membrane fusion protein
MKPLIVKIAAIILLASLSACSGNQQNTAEHSEEHHEHEETLKLPVSKIKDLELNIGQIDSQMIYTTVRANGVLAVPPQNRLPLPVLLPPTYNLF